MNQKQNEKLKKALQYLVGHARANYADVQSEVQMTNSILRLLDEAFEPETAVEQKHTCRLGCMLGYCAVVQGLKEPSKQKETGENKTREQKQHESNIAVENNKAGFFFGYQKGREDRTAEIQGYLNQPGLEEESAFFKELLKNV